MPASRRTFLQATAAAATAAAALAPRSAVAAPEPAGGHIHAALHELRGREDRIRQEYLDSVYDDRPAAGDRELTPHIHALAGGLAALSTIKDLEQMPVADQVHPRVQHAIRDAATAVGAATIRCRELLEVFLGDDGPDRETHLRAGLRGVRMSLRDWPTSAARQTTVDVVLAEVEAETEPGALTRRARKSVARIRKAERLATEIDARGERTEIFGVRDPAVLAQIDAGRARWSEEPADAPPLPDDDHGLSRKGALALGIVILAVGCAVGGILVLVGACSALCGWSGGLVVLLAGMAIIGLSIWGGLTFLKRGRAMPREEARDDAGGAGPHVVMADVHVPVLGADGWVDAGVDRGVATTVLVRSTGLVRMRARWMADADGNGETAGAGAFVPAAPLGALVGRVGDDCFFLGSEGVVPEGPVGRLQLAVNAVPGARSQAPRGHFAAHVTVYGPDDAA
jgi:hypothetical protein